MSRWPELRTRNTAGPDGFPAFVVQELWNWSRWCWTGEWPHPMPPQACGSVERAYPSGQDREGDEPPRPIPVCVETARRVQILYDFLPLAEQRIMQEEFPRRHEYGDMKPHERQDAAARKIGISLAYYKVSLNHIKSLVWNEFR